MNRATIEEAVLADAPIQLVARLHAEMECEDAGMDMNHLRFLRWLFDHSVDHPEFTIVDMLKEEGRLPH